MPIEFKTGSSFPLGASKQEDVVNFSLFASGVKKPLFLQIQDINNKLVIINVEVVYSTNNIFHIAIKGLPSSFIYHYTIGSKKILDPYAKSICWEKGHPKGIFKEKEIAFHWEKKKRIDDADLIIYEMHVRGFTKDSSSNTAYPGTFLGLIEKIPHLKDLGINAVELMPITEFNPHEYPPKGSLLTGKLCQYWGYSTVNFFSPMSYFGSVDAILEFKQMVQALHKAGIEVILDMVFNHTAEGNNEGPIINFKELGKKTYYLFNKDGSFANYTGCGNTVRCNHPVCIQLIIEVLRYFTTEMNIDGFRFDLASIFYRGENGHVSTSSPLLDLIAHDPLLSTVKLIAEPWDAAGLYQVGNFYSKNTQFKEWNARYRDAIREFIKGFGSKGEFATRLSGSEDLYKSKTPQTSINFITSHDGFSLQDLVSYNHKHNLANGEDNRDGANHNSSWNCGIEGTTNDPEILKLRLRQMCNFHLALMVSQGIPMLTMGDEYGHTKHGNNNTWCQDNPLNWFSWNSLQEKKVFYLFYKGLIHFRNETPLLKRKRFLNNSNIIWHGKMPNEPRWHEEDHFIAFALLDQETGKDLYIAFNASSKNGSVIFPKHKEGHQWKWIANTMFPEDFYEKNKSLKNTGPIFEMAPYSSFILISLPSFE